MTLEILSSIRGAKPSGAVNELFMIIKQAYPSNDVIDNINVIGDNVITLEDLRDDVIVESSLLEKEIIKENFPRSKNNFLVVSKVLED